MYCIDKQCMHTGVSCPVLMNNAALIERINILAIVMHSVRPQRVRVLTGNTYPVIMNNIGLYMVVSCIREQYRPRESLCPVFLCSEVQKKVRVLYT